MLLGNFLTAGGEDTVAENYGKGLNADLPTLERFFLTCYSTLRARLVLSSGEADPGLPVAFVLHAGPAPKHPKIMVSKVRQLDTGRRQLAGRIFYVNAGLTLAYCMELDSSDSDDYFGIIEELGHEQLPVFLYDPTVAINQVRQFANGVMQEETLVENFSAVHVSPESVYAHIDETYRQTLFTPDANTATSIKLWKKPQQWHPEENVEKIIQGMLRTGLAINLKGAFHVRPEITSDGEGRLDLLIEENLVGAVGVKHAILELKVLRTVSHTGKTTYVQKDHDEIVQKGVIQALFYRNNHQAHFAAICCFDMRKDAVSCEKTYACAQAAIEQGKLHPWWWRIYNSSEGFRAATHSAGGSL